MGQRGRQHARQSRGRGRFETEIVTANNPSDWNLPRGWPTDTSAKLAHRALLIL